MFSHGQEQSHMYVRDFVCGYMIYAPQAYVTRMVLLGFSYPVIRYPDQLDA